MSTPLKDWLYFSRPQRMGILVLLFLITGIPLITKVIIYYTPEKTIDRDRFMAEVHLFEEKLANLEQAIDTRADADAETISSDHQQVIPQEPKLTPFPFDPNTLTQEGWDSMNVPSYLGRTIRNYLSAGGGFTYKEDLQRIYLMKDEIYEELASFIQLPDRPEEPSSAGEQAAQVTRTDPSTDTNITASTSSDDEASTADLLIDVNLADTMELRQVRGIGPAFSRRIVGYRRLLGGYTSTEQLREVYGMDSTRFEQISPFLTADTTFIDIHKVDLNMADFGQLIRHPYLDRNMVNAILNLRQQHGPFASADDIRRSHLIDDESWQRVSPYVTAVTVNGEQ